MRCAVALIWMCAVACVRDDANTRSGLIDDPVTAREKLAFKALANPPDPPANTSNRYALNDSAAELGRKFYFDTDFSGPVSLDDMLLRRVTVHGHTQIGLPTRLSCNTCHDVGRAGGDSSAKPDGVRVALGAGAYDVDSQQTFNSGLYPLVYWNGRNDSLWSQVIAVVESLVSMNSSRLRVAWRIADAYREDYQRVFSRYPLPKELDSVVAQQGRLLDDGTCRLDGGDCPELCHWVTTPQATQVCLPRFPLEGRPGFVPLGTASSCIYGTLDVNEPNKDVYDCMDVADQLAITRVFVNFAKAIEAYEFRLASRDSDFDRWVNSDFAPGVLSPEAVLGARLFVGKAGCTQCHSGTLLSDGKFHNVGVPQEGIYVPRVEDCAPGAWCDCTSDDTHIPTNCLPWGFRDGLRKLQANKFRRDSRWSDDLECSNHFTYHLDPNYAATHPDECDGRVGYYSMPLEEKEKGAWRTPSLRDVTLTGPYMHNGMYATLREVVEHYNRLGIVASQQLIGARDAGMVDLNLDDAEIDAIVAFLQTLTGRPEKRWTEPPALPPLSPF